MFRVIEYSAMSHEVTEDHSKWNGNRDLDTPYSRVSLRMTLSDLEWLSEIFNDTKHRAVSLRQLSFLFTYIESAFSKLQFLKCSFKLINHNVFVFLQTVYNMHVDQQSVSELSRGWEGLNQKLFCSTPANILTLYRHIKTAEQRIIISYSNTVIGTLAVDGWAVTVGTARTGLGGAPARPSPSSLYQM